MAEFAPTKFDVFDRCIDIKLYRATGSGAMIELYTPTTGVKPDISVESTLLDFGVGVSTRIILTNFCDLAVINSADYIAVSMYYREQMVRYWTLYNILDVLPSDGPPNRTVTLNCCVPSAAVEFLGGYSNLPDDIDETTGTRKAPTIQSAMDAWSADYNQAIAAITNSAIVPSLQLNYVEYKKLPKLPKLKAHLPRNMTRHKTLKRIVGGSPSMEKDNKDGEPYYTEPADVVVVPELTPNALPQGNIVRIVPRPHYYDDGSTFTEYTNAKPDGKVVPLDYVLSAYINGPVIQIRMLYNPTLRVGDWCSIPTRYLLSFAGGRRMKVGQKIIPIDSDTVYFYVLPGTKIQFGTVRNNFMIVRGCIQQDEPNLVEQE